MSSYDSWLERPYQQMAAQDEGDEFIVEQVREALAEEPFLCDDQDCDAVAIDPSITVDDITSSSGPGWWEWEARVLLRCPLCGDTERRTFGADNIG